MSRAGVFFIGIMASLSTATATSAPLTLSIDPSQSTITFSDLFAGVSGSGLRLKDEPLITDPEEQEPGSSETTLSGSLEVDLDLGAETLAFIGGSVIDAAVTGTNLVTDDSGNQGEADMAIQLDSFSLQRTYFSLTNLFLDVEQTSMALVDGGGFFTVAAGQSFDISNGELNVHTGLDFFPEGTFVQTDMTALSGDNLTSGAVLTVTGTDVELVLPFELEIQAAVEGLPEGGIVLEGQIVATGIVPEPATGILFATALLLLAPLALKRHRFDRRR